MRPLLGPWQPPSFEHIAIGACGGLDRVDGLVESETQRGGRFGNGSQQNRRVGGRAPPVGVTNIGRLAASLSLPEPSPKTTSNNGRRGRNSPFAPGLADSGSRDASIFDRAASPRLEGTAGGFESEVYLLAASHASKAVATTPKAPADATLLEAGSGIGSPPPPPPPSVPPPPPPPPLSVNKVLPAARFTEPADGAIII